MKFPLVISVLVLGAMLAGRVEAAEPEVVREVWDFTQAEPTYGYEAWEGLSEVGTRTDAGWLADGTARGGLGLLFPGGMDLGEATHLRIRMIVGDAHNDGRMMVKFHGMDGRQAAWFVDPSGYPENQEAEVLIDLKNPDEASQEEPLDLGQVAQMQIQGTFNPANRFHITFVGIDGVVEQ